MLFQSALITFTTTDPGAQLFDAIRQFFYRFCLLPVDALVKSKPNKPCFTFVPDTTRSDMLPLFQFLHYSSMVSSPVVLEIFNAAFFFCCVFVVACTRTFLYE